jgi:hypothetical protein
VTDLSKCAPVPPPPPPQLPACPDGTVLTSVTYTNAPTTTANTVGSTISMSPSVNAGQTVTSGTAPGVSYTCSVPQGASSFDDYGDGFDAYAGSYGDFGYGDFGYGDFGYGGYDGGYDGGYGGSNGGGFRINDDGYVAMA